MNKSIMYKLSDIKFKLIVLGVAVSMIPLVLFFRMVGKQRAEVFRNNNFHELSLTESFMKNRILDFLDAEYQHVEFLRTDTTIQNAALYFMTKHKKQVSINKSDLYRYIGNISEKFHWKNVLLIDKTGHIVLSQLQNQIGQNVFSDHMSKSLGAGLLFLKHHKKQNVFFSDFQKSSDGKKDAGFFLGRIADKKGNFLGYIVLELDKKVLHSLFVKNSFSKFVKTYLMSRDKILQVSNSDQGGPVVLDSQKFNAVLQGKSEIFVKKEGKDKIVFSAYTPVVYRDADWVLISEMIPYDNFVFAKKITQKFSIFLLIVLIIVITIFYFIASFIANPLDKTTLVLQEMADGNLSQTITVDKINEYSKMGMMQRSVNSLILQLKTLITIIKDSANKVALVGKDLSFSSDNLSENAQKHAASMEEVSSTIIQLTNSIESISDKAQTQASSIEEITATIEELNSSVEALYEKTKEMRDNSQLAVEFSESAKDTAAQAINGMERIETSSHKIENIVTTINDIADQTNLLALNASIEAARAGDAGRGFAVVAKEISNLADKSAKATKEISDLVIESVSSVEDGSQMINHLTEIIEKLRDSVKISFDFGNNMVIAMEEQLTGFKQTADAVQNINQMAQGIAAASEENSSAVEELQNTFTTINQVSQEIAENSEVLKSAAQGLEENAEELRENIARFKY